MEQNKSATSNLINAIVLMYHDYIQFKAYIQKVIFCAVNANIDQYAVVSLFPVNARFSIAWQQKKCVIKHVSNWKTECLHVKEANRWSSSSTYTFFYLYNLF